MREVINTRIIREVIGTVLYDTMVEMQLTTYILSKRSGLYEFDILLALEGRGNYATFEKIATAIGISDDKYTDMYKEIFGYELDLLKENL